MSPRAFVTAIGAAVMLVTAGGVIAQDNPVQPVPSRTVSAAQYIEVGARVSDANGNPVRGLRKEDFQLFEDDVAQTIDTVTAIDIPIATRSAASATTAVDPDVVTNTDHAPGRARFYVLLLDDRQIAPEHTANAVRIATTFIERRLSPADMVAVVTTSGRTDMSLSFTPNRQLLMSSVGKLAGHKPESIVLGRLAPGSIESSLQAAHFLEANAALSSLDAVCRWLGTVRGTAKSLILISEGVDYDYEADAAVDPWAADIVTGMRRAVAAATRANVTVYAFDPREARRDDSQTPAATASALQQELVRARSSLTNIATRTGGTAWLSVAAPGAIDAVLDRVVRDSSAYYLLGYRPASARREGKTRSVRIAVTAPGTNVAARRDYDEPDGANPADGAEATAALDDNSQAARDALNSPLPRTEMTLSTTAVPFRGEDEGYKVAVILESPSVTLLDKGDKYRGAIEMVVAVIGERNEIASGHANMVGFGLDAENVKKIEPHGMRTMSLLPDLIPGRYELRVATVDRETAKLGSAWFAFEVPDFWTPKLAMSGVLLASRSEGPRILNAWMEFVDAMPIPPTTVREFHAGDELTMFAEIYDNDLASDHQVTVSATVTAADGAAMFKATSRLSQQDFAQAKGAYRFKEKIPLTDVSPGAYVIRIEATRNASDDAPIVRAIPITIVK